MRRLLGRLAAGAVAGVIATGTMSIAMDLARRAGMLGEPPPRKLTRRLLGRFGVHRGRPRTLALTSAMSHVAFGAAGGMLFALAPASTSAGAGSLFGLGVWASSYAGWIPSVGLMAAPSEDRPGRPLAMILAHLVYGATLGSVRRRLSWGQASLRGKVAVVCGGSRGLGRAIAHELANRGASVAICARSADDVARTRAELETFAVPVFAEVCDLRSEGETRAFLERTAARLGPVDLLVTNAATITVGPIESATAGDFHDAMGSIFGTALHPALAVLPSMRTRRTGIIAFIASIGGKLGVPHLAPYSAAKFAEVGLAEALRAEVAKDGVHVMTVIPGLMRTGSALRATFQGAPEKELAWFGAAAAAPAISIDADAAARRIVRAMARKDTEVILTAPARIAVRTHDVLPSLWSFVMRIAGSLLPGQPAREPVGREEGRDIPTTSSSALLDFIRRRQERFARRHGQLAGR